MGAGSVCKNPLTNGFNQVPTLAELMVDPLILAVMAADRVDPAALDASLRALARKRWPAGDPIGAGRSARG
jgi:hypothetical protein